LQAEDLIRNIIKPVAVAYRGYHIHGSGDLGVLCDGILYAGTGKYSLTELPFIQELYISL
jgi:1,4-dihydroxy-2-naphthoyl-CoA synthase